MTQVRVFTPLFSMCVKTRREEWIQANAARETSKCSLRAAGSRGQRGVMRFLAETQPLPLITGVTSGCHTGAIPGDKRGEGLCFVNEGCSPQAAAVRAGCGGRQWRGGLKDEGVSLRRMRRVWPNRKKKGSCKPRSVGKGQLSVS